MTYLPVPPEVSPHAGCVSVRVPRAVLAGVLVQVAETVRTGVAATMLWEDLGNAARAAQDDSLDPDDHEAEAEDALTYASELLDMASVNEDFELSWPVAERLSLQLLDVAHRASGRRSSVVLALPVERDAAEGAS